MDEYAGSLGERLGGMFPGDRKTLLIDTTSDLFSEFGPGLSQFTYSCAPMSDSYTPTFVTTGTPTNSVSFGQGGSSMPLQPGLSDSFATPESSLTGPLTPIQYNGACWSTPVLLPSPDFSGSSVLSHSVSRFSASGLIPEDTQIDCEMKEHSPWAKLCTQISRIPQSSQAVIDGLADFNTSSGVLTNSIYDPALSRNIFGSISSYELVAMNCNEESWSSSLPWSVPETVAPEAAFQPLISGSPGLEMVTMTPRKTVSCPSEVLHSSPPTATSSVDLSCQADIDCISEFIQSIPRKLPLVDIPHQRERRSHRLSRRHYMRKTLSSVNKKTPPSTVKSGMVCEAVIPQNTFACKYGCEDKVGKPKCFKRQEHRKRHERTVHVTEDGDEPEFFCWVRGCGKEEPTPEDRVPKKRYGFSRSDNLHTHFKTHGKKSSGRRNRYVATLDESSPFYDPKWEGALTWDGYPIIAGLTTLACNDGKCKELLHTELGMREHLLKSHGQLLEKNSRITLKFR